MTHLDELIVAQVLFLFLGFVSLLLLLDKSLADQVWELWAAGVITDGLAAGVEYGDRFRSRSRQARAFGNYHGAKNCLILEQKEAYRGRVQARST